MITVHFNQVFVEQDIALGNHLFQYCICRIVAMKNGYNFFIPYSGKLKECFPNLDLGVSDGIIRYGCPDLREGEEFNPHIYNVRDFTHLNGNYQGVKYYEDHEDLVKEWLKIEMDDEVQKVIDKYPVDEYCYIHLRGNSNKSSWFMTPKSFYEKGIAEMTKMKEDVKFVIITDDVELSKEFFPDIDVISGHYEGVMTDFKSLYFAKYSIISNSTFSWWPRWLSDGITFAPNHWLNYNKGGEFCPKGMETKKFIYI